MQDFLTLFEYAFIQRAFIAGSFTAIACATLGMFLVLRKMSLIGDGLSHVSFGAIALGLFLGVYPFLVAVPVAIIGSVLILKLSERSKMYGDAAIGIVSVVGVATGVVLSSISGGFNVDLFSYLFGSILAIGVWEVWMSVILSLVVLGVLWVLYWDLFAMTFDEEYALVAGVNTKALNIFLAILTALTVVLSVKVVGILLVSALLILPAMTALQLSNRFFRAIALSVIIALIAVVAGILLSFFFDIPSGATIVLLLAGMFGLAFLFGRER
jgi:zinc transport system permease protein